MASGQVDFSSSVLSVFECPLETGLTVTETPYNKNAQFKLYRVQAGWKISWVNNWL